MEIYKRKVGYEDLNYRIINSVLPITASSYLITATTLYFPVMLTQNFEDIGLYTDTENPVYEIVDFSGVEKYIDTPVKRYSSGMYVRLAFAVAAHLQAEILIIDEVLAVGDSDFQKKCIGKMNEISAGQGKTILFVSHNMSLINSFCKKGFDSLSASSPWISFEKSLNNKRYYCLDKKCMEVLSSKN